jgi:hypothetical protein
LALALTLTSDHSHPSVRQILLGELVGLSFRTAGLLGMWRRPGNRSGRCAASRPLLLIGTEGFERELDRA